VGPRPPVAASRGTPASAHVRVPVLGGRHEALLDRPRGHQRLLLPAAGQCELSWARTQASRTCRGTGPRSATCRPELRAHRRSSALLTDACGAGCSVGVGDGGDGRATTSAACSGGGRRKESTGTSRSGSPRRSSSALRRIRALTAKPAITATPRAVMAAQTTSRLSQPVIPVALPGSSRRPRGPRQRVRAGAVPPSAQRPHARDGRTTAARPWPGTGTRRQGSPTEPGRARVRLGISHDQASSADHAGGADLRRLRPGRLAG
jgi:hypothetical protein